MESLQKILGTQKPIYTKIAEDVDFFALFKKIERKFETCFLLESLGEEGKFSRYSVIGFDPATIISAHHNKLTVGSEVKVVKNPYGSLREMMPTKTFSRDYSGGLIGYLSYEAINYMEPAVSVKVHADFPQFMFGAYADGIVFDKLTNEVSYFHHGVDRQKQVLEILHEKDSPVSFEATFLKDGLTKVEHEEVVEKVKEHIRAGNTFQCEVGYKSEYKIEGEAIAVYEKLREVNPSPFMYYLKFGSRKVVGASPELLFSLRDGEMTTRPLAGTTKRGATELEDQKLARELLNDPKECAEHTMLVDLHRNDIGRVARFGTVRIRDLMTIKKFSHVQHMSSEISGIIDAQHDMFSALASNFPMGTICGTPKVETIKIIDENEPEARGPYGGGVGNFGWNGDCTFALTLRSVFLNGEKAYTQTCGGIVYDSVPEQEYEEIQRKSAAMRKVLINSQI